MRAFGRYRQLGARIQALAGLVWVMAIGLLCASAAHGAVALLLEDPYGHMGRMNPSGHAAIYLDQVCAETPLRLRPCRPGEYGVVLSRYDGIGHHDWVAIPLIPYLYAVDRPEDIPVTVGQRDVDRLRDQYRRRHLEEMIPDGGENGVPGGNWYELAGSAYDRTIYGFQVRSTPAQDAQLIALFNDRRNVEQYNGMFRNCADFARVTLNRFYPHAVRRNWIADLGMTSPKSVARALTHYAGKHPEAGLQEFRVTQISGELPRSQNVQDLVEGLLKEYGVPLIVLSPETAAAVLVAYVGHGRFTEPKDAPVLNLRAGLTMPNSVTPASLAGGPPVETIALDAAGTELGDVGAGEGVVLTLPILNSESRDPASAGEMAGSAGDTSLPTLAGSFRRSGPQ